MTTFIKSKAAKAVVGLLALAVFAIASSASAAYTFTQNLTVGSTSSEVTALQVFLNTNGFTVSTTGAGSPGMESNYFGAKTRTALAAFQAAKGISPAVGYFGPLTRQTINAWSGSTTLPAGCTSASGYSSTTGAPCSTGSSLVPGCTSTTGYSSTTGLSCAGGSTPAQTGPVTAALSVTNPASGVVVAGQATANFLNVTFSGSGIVNSVSLKRTGISDQSTLSNVYLYDGVTRLTDGYSFNNLGVLTINNLNLAVNGTKTISVVGDVYASAPSGQTIALALTSFTSGTSVSSVNVQGNTMSVAAGGTLASVTFPSVQSVTAATVNAGTSSYAVYRQALQVNTRTVWLKAANFRITGSAQSNAVANAGLYVDGVKVGNNATMTMTNGSNYLSFDLSAMPFALTTGSHTMEIRADIVAGSSYNFTVALQQASDLMILDPQVGVNIAVSSFTASAGAVITIGAGSATFTVDPSFSAMTNVTGGASNAVIGRFKIHGYGEDVKITSLPITVTLSAAATPAGLQNVTLYFNGSQVGSQTTLTAASGVPGTLGTNNCATTPGTSAFTCYTTTFTLGSQLIIPAGADSILEVRADLRNAAGTNYTAGAVAANLQAGVGEGFTSHTAVATPAVTGTSLTLQTGLLAVAKNTGYANQTVNPNTSGVKIGSFVLQNQSSSESVRVTSLAVGLTNNGTTVLTTGTTPALTNFAGLRTSETSGSGSTPVQPQAANNFSVDFTLAPGATKIIDIFADTSSATTGNVVATLTVNALGSSSNTSICVDADNNCTNGGSGVAGQTIGLSAGTVAAPTLLTASTTSAQYIAAGDPMLTGTGAVDGSRATFTFVSSGGASTISELKFTITGTATNPVMSIKVGSVSAPVVGGVAWLQGLNLMVPNGGSGLTVDALITYAPVGTSGVTPATTAITTLDYVKYSSGGTTTVLTPSVAAPTITLVGSKPTVSVNTTQSLGLILGAENKIGEVTVSADAKGNIKVNDIKFAVGSSNITTFAVASPRIADGTTTVTGSSCGADVTVTTTIFCEFADAGATATGTQIVSTEVNTDFDGYTIAAGTSKTFSLYGTVTGTVTTGGGTTTVSTSVNAAGFNWDDSSTNGASGTALTGTLLYNFPSGSYSIRQ